MAEIWDRSMVAFWTRLNATARKCRGWQITTNRLLNWSPSLNGFSIAGRWRGRALWSELRASRSRFWLSVMPQQPGQPSEVAGAHRQDEEGTDPFADAVDGLGKAADGLAPAQRLLDPLAMFPGQGVARVSGRAAVDRRVPGSSRYMGRDAGLSQVANEGGRVVAPVRAERQLAGGARGMGVDHVERCTVFCMAVRPGKIGPNDQAAPVLHERMVGEAQSGVGAERLLVESRVGIDGRSVGCIRTLLFTEGRLWHCGTAVGAEHRGGFERGLFGAVFVGAMGVKRAARVASSSGVSEVFG